MIKLKNFSLRFRQQSLNLLPLDESRLLRGKPNTCRLIRKLLRNFGNSK